MARPLKNNCDYFQHFTTMRNHPKIKALRAKFGTIDGYAFWAMFVEYLTGLDNNQFKYNDLEIELFSGELGLPSEKIKEMLDYCINKLELLSFENGVIFSITLNERLAPVYEKRGNSKERASSRKRDNDGSFSKNSKEIRISATETLHIIEDKRIKENKESENERIDKVIDLLNRKSGKAFRKDTPKYRTLIFNLLNANYTGNDFLSVIDKKSKEWLGTEMEKFLQPTTLFRPDKFDEYLNQKEVIAKPKSLVKNDGYDNYPTN